MIRTWLCAVIVVAAAALVSCGGEEGADPVGAGGACATSNDCAAGACVAGVCDPTSCERDSQCNTAANERCDFSTSPPRCVARCQEGASQPCSTACGDGTETCTSGVWSGCNAPLPEEEICNQEDDDCDGATDEDLQCGGGVEGEGEGGVEGEGEGGQEGEGEGGQEGEGEGGQEGEGEGGVEGEGEGPPPCEPTNGGVEICDNLDNDCNDQVDDGLTQECSSDCGTGTEQCAAGQWVGCDARQPLGGENCGNNIDDDCDGETDEVAECPPQCVPVEVIQCDGVDQNCDNEDEFPGEADLRNLDPREPNDTCDCAPGSPNYFSLDEDDELHVELRGVLYVGDNDDYYCFDGVDRALGRESLDANLSFIPGDVNYDLYLYEGEEACRNNEVLQASENAGQGQAERIQRAENLAGWNLKDERYYVRVRRVGGVNCTEQYTLGLTWTR